MFFDILKIGDYMELKDYIQTYEKLSEKLSSIGRSL